jgi:hypothetical protein
VLFGGELAGVAVHVGYMQVRFDLTHRILRFLDIAPAVVDFVRGLGEMAGVRAVGPAPFERDLLVCRLLHIAVACRLIDLRRCA